MAVSDQQKIDFLLKKIGFTKTKTGSTVGTGAISGTPKQPFAEALPSPLVVPNSSLWNEADSIPATPPGSDTNQVKVYATASAVRMTADATSSGQRAYIAYSTYNDTSSVRLTNWIDTQFGALYLIKVFRGDPNSGGVALSSGATNENWFFDYSAGVLNFNDSNVPSGVNDTNIYIVGYRYIGQTGAPTSGISTFSYLDLAVERNLDVGVQGGISTFRNNIDANGIIEGIAGQNKIPFLYSNMSDLPSAGTYHGMFAHVHATGRGYFAHAGGWHELVNVETNGNVGTGTQRYLLGSLVSTSTTAVSLNVTGISTFGGNLDINSDVVIDGNIDLNGDIDVDGHTNLDNISVAGVSTFAGDATFNANVKFDGANAGRDITFERAQNSFVFADNALAKFGNSEDFKLFHDGSNSYIRETGTGSLILQSNETKIVNSANNETIAKFNENSSVELYHDSDFKFETTSSGVNVSGTTTTTGLVVSGVSTFTGAIDANGDLDVDGHTNLDNVSIAGVTTANGNITISNEAPRLKFHDTNHNPDFDLLAEGGSLFIQNTTNPSNAVIINLTTKLATFGGGVDVDDFVDVGSNIQLGNAGVITATTFKGDGDFVELDVDGHTNLDNVSVAGVTTFTGAIDLNADLDVDGHSNLDNVSIAGFTTITQDLNVDGHTNLDNVSVAGVTTFGNFINLDGDDREARFGAGNDLAIKWDGSKGGVYTDEFRVKDRANNVNMLAISKTGALRAYHNGSNRLDTTSAGIEVFGSVVATGADINGDIDVDGHTNLDNVSIAGVSTFAGAIDLNADLDVDGHTNLDNISVSGVSTFAGDATFNGNVSIGGTLTYEDVKNVDSVGLMTARAGINVTGGVITALAAENKIPSLYSAMSNLPNAGTYHGMFAHVHATARGYFAHAGNWMELVNKEINGVVGTGTETYNIGNLVSTSSTTTSLNVSGVTTTTTLDVNGDLDISGTIKGYDYLVAPHGGTTTITVTVASKTSAHRYNGTGSGDGFVFDGFQAPFITLTPGRTYKFDQSDNSNSSHPIRFYLNADRSIDYTDGVTTNGTPGSSGAYTQIVVTDKTPTVLHYQCQNHSYMGNAAQLNSSAVVTTDDAQIYGNLCVKNSGISTFTGQTNIENALSVSGVTTFASNAYFGDNDKIIFGSGNRFQIYDNGTSAIIDNSYGGGSILRLGSGNQVVLGSQLSNNQTLIRGVVNGPAELYHAGAKKLETYSSGINVTGNTVADGLVIDGDSDLNGDLDVDGHTNLDNVSVAGVTTFAENVFAQKKLSFGDSNASTTNLATFGAGDDMKIYHSGVNNHINVTGGGMLIPQASRVMVLTNNYSIVNTASSKTLFKALNDNQVELYFNGVKRLETTAQGIEVTGHSELDNVNIAGVTTFAGAIDLNADLDVDGHTNLDNVSIAGVTTTAGNVDINAQLDVSGQANLSGVTTTTSYGLTTRDLYTSGITTVFKSLHVNGRYANNDGILPFVVTHGGYQGIQTSKFTATLNNYPELVLENSWGGNWNTTGPWKLKWTSPNDGDAGPAGDGRVLSELMPAVGNAGNLGGFRLRTTDGSTGLKEVFLLNSYNSSFYVNNSSGRTTALRLDGVGVGITNYIYHYGNSPSDTNTRFGFASNGIIQFDVDGTERFRLQPNLVRFSNLSTGVDIDADLDVDGHTNLDNVSIAGVTTFAGDLTISSILPRITLNDTNNESDYEIKNENGSFRIRDIDNPTDRYRINSSGTIHEFFGTADFASHLTVDGIITANGNIDANGDLDVDGHTNLDNLSVAGVSTFSDAATFSSTVTHNSTTSLNDDVTFTGASYNVLWDKSDNALEFNDNSKATFGTSVDLTIFHDGSNSFITEGGTGGLFIKSSEIQIQTDGGNKYFTGISNVAKLYHTNNEKLATTSTGINVTGLTDTDTLTTGNATFTGTIIAGGSSGSNGQYLKSTGSGVAWENYPAARTTQSFTASSGQTTFSFSYNVGYLDVFVNGVKLSSSEFTATNGTSVVLSVGSFVGDIVELVSYNTIVSGGGGGSLSNVVEDTTPQLGGNLDLLSKTINGTGGISITGVVTATTFIGDGSGLTGIVASGSGVVVKNSGSTVGTAGTINFGDNLSVTPISAGIVTITGSAGVNTSQFDVNKLDVSGISTFSGNIDVNADLDVDGHTNLDNVNISGVTTCAQTLHFPDVGGSISGAGAPVAKFGNSSDLIIGHDGSDSRIRAAGAGQLILSTANGFRLQNSANNHAIIVGIPNGRVDLFYANSKKLETTAQGINVTGHSELDNVNISGVVTATTFKGALQGTSGTFSSNVDITGDLDVNGHTDLDNVSIAGVVTATTFVGALTGNVTGNVSGSSGSATGNAATATALETARDIGGVSFDGSASINLPGVNASGNQDTSGTAAVATNVTVSANNSTNETVYPVFVDGATGSQGAETDTGLTYNPSTGNLTATKFTGDGSGLTGVTASGSGIVIKHDGSTVGTAGTINFGTNLDVSAISGGAVTITASGGSGSGISTISGVVNIANDLDVDGHTNLDNVSISGVSTVAGNCSFAGGNVTMTASGSPNSLNVSGTSRFEIASMENALLDGEIAHTGDTNTLIKFPSNDNISFDTGGTTRLNINNSGATVTGTLAATAITGDGSGLTGVSPAIGITTNLSGSFTASAGSPSTINTYGYGSGDIVVEYTVFIKNGSNFQTQKLLAMRDGTTIHSTQFAVMFSSSLLVQLDATISSGNILLRATPETGVSGSTTYKVKREVM